MNTEEKLKWICYHTTDDGPHSMLIIDWIWWERHKEQILIWFDRNYPELKPNDDQVIIKFENQEQYTMWNITWG